MPEAFSDVVKTRIITTMLTQALPRRRAQPSSVPVQNYDRNMAPGCAPGTSHCAPVFGPGKSTSYTAWATIISAHGFCKNYTCYSKDFIADDLPGLGTEAADEGRKPDEADGCSRSLRAGVQRTPCNKHRQVVAVSACDGVFLVILQHARGGRARNMSSRGLTT